jgi:UDP-N-acetylglucosamine--N-acetylmuramyl-(pentapeptide) pyrophosphoryl-undecaprenol N-acetylglucosamine transferase
MTNNKKIAILTGGTGGHIFPAQAIAEKLVLQGYAVTILANKNYQKFHSSKKYDFKIIAATYPKKDFSLIKFPFVLFYGFIQSLLWFLINKPQKTISFGSYATFPSLVAATLLRKEIILHEQNSILGKVNKIFAKFAKKIALSYQKTEGLKIKYQNKVILVGNPVRKEIESLRNNKFILPHYLQKNSDLDKKFFNKNVDEFNILILGGSGGAAIFGVDIVEAMNSLNKDLVKFSVTHQCHQKNLTEVKKLYQKHKIKANVSVFFTNISSKIKKSHLIISRAGSSAISEFICATKPFILVPFAQSSNSHQLKNARSLENKGCAIVIEEKNFNSKKITKIIDELIKNPQKLIEMMESLKKLNFTKSKDVAKKILEVRVL